jgi:hypothetical protein
VVKPPVKPPAPSPAPVPAAQLPQMTPAVESLIKQILMETDETDLFNLTTALRDERDKERKDLRDKLKSRKA